MHKPVNYWHLWCFAITLFNIGRVTHICVGKLTIFGSDNGLSLERRQAIIWTNAGILLIGPLGTNFSELLIEIQTFSLKKIRLKMSSAKCCSFHLGINIFRQLRMCSLLTLRSASHPVKHITQQAFLAALASGSTEWATIWRGSNTLALPCYGIKCVQCYTYSMSCYQTSDTLALL